MSLAIVERTRMERFDDVYQIVLIVVALSFDILWFFGYIPVAEIAVFIFVLIIWAYGNLRGDEWEYSLKLGSFNFSIILLSSFYYMAVRGSTDFLNFWEVALATIIIPIVCLGITLLLVAYLKENIIRRPTLILLLNETVGYMVPTFFVALTSIGF